MVEENMTQAANGVSGGSRRKSWWGIGFVILVVFAVMYKMQPTSGGVVWGSDYEKGLALAQEANKPILLAFHNPGCGFCMKMKGSTYRDSDVIELVEGSFVPILLSADKETELANRFVELGFPSYTVLNSDGSKIKTFEGYHTAKDYIEQLAGALGR